jgi:hypothetical protein
VARGGGARPSIVAIGLALGAAGGAPGVAAPGVAAAAAAPGAITTKEFPHFGQRIFSPVGGTRRSSMG